jgi:alpha-tubulin suppressor-like RCC1 family protein
MSINIESLKSRLAAEISALSDSATAEDILMLSVSVANITEDRITTVANPNELPLLQTGLSQSSYPSGIIFYVLSRQVLVISSNGKWIGLDGRVLRNDQPTITAYSWGYNNQGQLGDGTTASKSSPVTIVGGITDWRQISSFGGSHSLGVTASGRAYAWGANSYGRLGDGTTTSRLSPVTVVGGLNWSKVSAGSQHSVGITTTGVAYGWGRNNNGQVGDANISTSYSSPVTVAGGLTWSQVDAGSSFTLGLTTAGVLYAWGANSSGQLGDNSTTQRSSPVTVAGGLTWSQVSAGQINSVGITTTGVAYGWGNNNYGQMGSALSGRSSPNLVSGGRTWAQVSCGNFHCLGITTAGVAWGWGQGSGGKLGTGNTSNSFEPVSVVGGITNWSSLIASGDFSLGLTSSGAVYAWGYNSSGQIGDGTTTSRLSPVTIAGGLSNWALIGAGSNRTAFAARIA